MAKTYQGRCHCGAVHFEVDLADGFETARRCNCSLCRRKGAVMAMVPRAGLRVTQGEDQLSVYQWNTRAARHYFCRVCGIYTHHQRRIDPNTFGFNVGCIDAVDPLSFGDVPVVDGASLSTVQ